jgi:hypothetical protein
MCVRGDVGLQGPVKVESSRGLLLTSTRGTIKLLLKLPAFRCSAFEIFSIPFFTITSTSIKLKDSAIAKRNRATISQRTESKSKASYQTVSVQIFVDHILHTRMITLLRFFYPEIIALSEPWFKGSASYAEPHLIKHLDKTPTVTMEVNQASENSVSGSAAESIPNDGTGVVQLDPWLAPFKDSLRHRFKAAQDWIQTINDTEGGLEKFSRVGNTGLFSL